MHKIKEVILNNKKLVVITLLLSSVLFLVYFFQLKKIKNQMKLQIQFIEEKNILRDELDDLIDEHDYLLEEYSDLNREHRDEDSLIRQQITEIRNLIRVQNDLKEARKKIENLKIISKKYLSNIDSLLVINKKLTSEKDSIINVNKDINWKNYRLNQQNKQLTEKVSKGSILELFDLEISPIRFRATGREISTKYAKKVQILRVCFSVAQNKITNEGIKDVYMHLIFNGNTIINPNDSISTNINDSLVFYTHKAEVDYQNVEVRTCSDWQRGLMLEAGTYSIKLYIDGNLSATKEFILK